MVAVMRFPSPLTMCSVRATLLFGGALGWFMVSVRLVAFVADILSPDWAEFAWLVFFFVSALLYLRVKRWLAGS